MKFDDLKARHLDCKGFKDCKDVDEFKRAYDSIDSSAKMDSPKTKSNPSNGDRLNNSDEN